MVEFKDKFLRLLNRPETLMGMGITVVVLAVIGIIGTTLGPKETTPEPTITPTLAQVQYTPNVATFTPGPTTAPTTETQPEPVNTIILPTPTPGVTRTHTVKEGDTLLGIAIEYDVTLEALMAANGMTDDLVYLGDVLTIPAPAATAPIVAPAGVGVIHTVAENETLGEIALKYGITTEALLAANNLGPDDFIHVGQQLVIPDTVTGTPTPSAAAPGNEEPWEPSILDGDLAAAYPETVERERYTLHYPPGSLPAQEVDAVLAMIDTAISQIEVPLSIHLQGHFDVYVAGSLFAAPDLALRGRSFSSQRRLFFLWDGTGDEADRQYIITHESTHTFTWNSIGAPASVMLHEGVAVFTGMPNYENAGYIRLEHFCAAYHQAGNLPMPADDAPFMGHIYDLANYYSAGCFVRYLIRTYGADKFASVYTSDDYAGIYGQTLLELQGEWLVELEATTLPAGLDPDTLVTYIETVQQAYTRLFENFTGTPEQMTAYRALDQARTTMLAGRFDEAETHLATFRQYVP